MRFMTSGVPQLNPTYWEVVQAVIEFGYGVIICWMLNLVQLGIAFLLLAGSEKMLPFVYVLLAALGLVQIGYVAPLYRLLRRKKRFHAAHGLLTAACCSLLVNAALDYHFFGLRMFSFWR